MAFHLPCTCFLVRHIFLFKPILKSPNHMNVLGKEVLMMMMMMMPYICKAPNHLSSTFMSISS